MMKMTSFLWLAALLLLLLSFHSIRAEEEEEEPKKKKVKCNFEKRGEILNPAGDACLSVCTDQQFWVRGEGCRLRCATDEVFNKKEKECQFICNNDRDNFFFDERLGSCEFLACPASKGLVELENEDEEEDDGPIKCGCIDETRVFKNAKRGCVCAEGFIELSKTCVPEDLLDEKLCIDGVTFFDVTSKTCICADGALLNEDKQRCECPFENTRFVQRKKAPENSFCKCKKGFVEQEDSRDCVAAE